MDQMKKYLAVSLVILVLLSGCTQQIGKEKPKKEIKLKIINDSADLIDFSIKETNITNPKLREILGNVSYSILMNVSIIVDVKNVGSDGESNLTVAVGYDSPELEKYQYKLNQNFISTDSKTENVHLKSNKTAIRVFNFSIVVPSISQDILEKTKFENSSILDLLYYKISW